MIKGRGQQAEAIECKINPDHFDPTNLSVFRSLYPEGGNYVLSPNIKSLRVVFPAACGEFVIPAEAGIQKTGLDSASSAE